MIKKRLIFALTVSLGIWGLESVSAQNQPLIAKPTPPPIAVPKLSTLLARNFEQQNSNITREQREKAYAKLLEGQRYYWNSTPRSKTGNPIFINLAKQAFLKAVELDPNLSEGYTALAEIALSTSGDIEEAIALANLSLKIFPDNFGAHRILARVLTIKSNLNPDPEKNETFDLISAQKAVAEWKEVARLDPRNAEAWAFLGEFYDKLNKPQERIEALQKWLSSVPPVEARFYRKYMGEQADLSPENASLKLGSALVKANRASEAIEILSLAVADDPENIEAIELLKLAVDSGSGESSAATIEALQRAVFANPRNLALVQLLAQVQSRKGQTDDAVKSLRATIAKLMTSDKDSAANLQVSLGDIFKEANRIDEAVAAYEGALKIQGIDKSELITDIDREFATVVLGKMIQTYKTAGRINDAKATIERARLLLGREDLFADRQLISLMRESGRADEALQAVRNLRTRMKTDYALLRLEALILTEMGRVEEGVALITPLIGKGKTLSAPSLMYDDFSNYIYISSLYNQAKRGREAVSSAQQAFSVAESQEKKQIAHLTLANAQQTSGDFKSAEEILRNLLKQTPKNPIALNNLGYFLLERDQKLDEAVSLIKQAVEIDPTNPSYLDSLGWAYFKLGKLGEAELYLKEAINNDGTSATVYEHLGDVYQKQGKEKLARDAWQKAMNLASGAEVNNRLKDKLAKLIEN
jgi:tetratricopeptide (TPR) repeat protein